MPQIPDRPIYSLKTPRTKKTMMENNWNHSRPNNYTTPTPIADGTLEAHQASPWRPQRRQFLIFEPETPDGTKIATKITFCILELHVFFHRAPIIDFEPLVTLPSFGLANHP
jgi:hypothetical protein